MNFPTLTQLIGYIKLIFEVFDKFLARLGIVVDWDKMFSGLSDEA